MGEYVSSAWNIEYILLIAKSKPFLVQLKRLESLNKDNNFSH